MGRSKSHSAFEQQVGHQLVSWRYGITGKPDHIVDHDGYPIPVLAKTGRAPTRNPHDSHVAQVLVYCLLIHEATQIAPPYGIIRYSDRTFEVEYTEAAVSALLEVIDEMHHARGTLPPRSHENQRRCAACRHRRLCDDSLL